MTGGRSREGGGAGAERGRGKGEEEGDGGGEGGGGGGGEGSDINYSPAHPIRSNTSRNTATLQFAAPYSTSLGKPILLY